MKYSLIAFIIGITVVFSLYFSLSTPSKYQARQVKSIPDKPVIPAQRLAVSKHIKFSERPSEEYDFPIKLGELGPTQALYAGENQYPFYCMTIDSKLGQPLVDNQKGWGVPVYDDVENIGEEAHIVGYSKDCSVATKISYAVELANGDIVLFEQPDQLPSKDYDYLYQIEVGTINRFPYVIIMPIEQIPTQESQQQVNTTAKWNNKLIYQFLGGSGIGFRQGKLRVRRAIERRKEQLHQGYAVVGSTGNKTSYTYNMLLAEDTARRVKSQFVSLYGEPEYTVGIGGSGGGLAQYLIGQNSTGILDAAIPLYSYPDMVSQTLYALDCDLFNNYYAYRADDRKFWQNWDNRVFVEGLNAKNGETHLSAILEPINQLISGRWPQMPKGNSECINGWFGLSTFIHNPAQGFLREFFADQVVDDVHWSYWEDMWQWFGRDNSGFANQTWDNQGVQYGFSALLNKQLSPAQFIDLNWNIGSWKPANEMEPESIFAASKGKKGLLWLSLWSRNNISEATDNKPAPRISASEQAVNMAYRSGQVFIGDIDIPIIDVRHYLEPALDMHHMSASFVSRLRIQQAKGHAKHQLIWVADREHNPVNQAFVAIDDWLKSIKQQPELPIWQAKPTDLNDQCFGAQGEIIARGDSVWNGKWNNKIDGSCAKQFPPFSNSRIAAGAPWKGNFFSCQKMPVAQAIEQGLYQDIDMRPYQQKLESIFPQGVCDYRFIDQARPADL